MMRLAVDFSTEDKIGYVSCTAIMEWIIKYSGVQTFKKEFRLIIKS
jgi:hypothetical protein